jgi:acetyl-CoA C-acetyltransferase
LTNTRRVAVVGAGMSPFGDRKETARQLFSTAVQECLQSVDNGIEPNEIQEAWIGSVAMGGHQLGNLGTLAVESIGLEHVPARRVENACASSGYALRDAYLAIRSGAIDIALVGGVEKMNDLSRPHQRYWLGVSGDTEWERTAGLTFAGVYALMARRHMHEYGTTQEQLAAVAVKNHANGAHNPKAQFQKPITLEKALGSATVCAPLKLFDCCSTTDGATALVLASEEHARRLTDAPVWITGSGASSDGLAAFRRESMTRIEATTRAAQAALGQARRSIKDVHVAEVHDCFTIAEILALEDLGYCKKGEGGSYAASGATARDGKTPINPSGGLKAKGHPLGATGAGQAYELFHQLRGEAGPRQVSGAQRGLTHNVGGSGASCAVHVFEVAP